MAAKTFCKSCLDTVMVSEEVIQELVREADEDISKIVTSEIYSARLTQCSSCEFLQYGTTCSYSGCIVRYRAKFKNKGCPHTGKPKWDRMMGE